MALKIHRPEKDVRQSFNEIGAIPANRMPTGSIVNVYFASNRNHTSVTTIDPTTVLEVEVFPKTKNSTFLILYTLGASYDAGGGHFNSHVYRVFNENATRIGAGLDGNTDYPIGSIANKSYFDGGSTDNNMNSISGQCYDQPGYSGPIKYQIRINSDVTTANKTVVLNRRYLDSYIGMSSELTVFEIAGR